MEQQVPYKCQPLLVYEVICQSPKKPSFTGPAWQRKPNLRELKLLLKFTELENNEVKVVT